MLSGFKVDGNELGSLHNAGVPKVLVSALGCLNNDYFSWCIIPKALTEELLRP